MTEEALELQTRRAVYNTVRACAGCHLREIQRRANVPAGTVRYHLNYLSRHGLISEQKEGNSLRYFPQDFVSNNKQLLSLLRQNSVRSVLLFVLTHPRCTHEAVVASAQLSGSTVTWHMKKLCAAKVITEKRDGRYARYEVVAPDEVVKLLVTYRQSFFDALVDNVIAMWTQP